MGDGESTHRKVPRNWNPVSPTREMDLRIDRLSACSPEDVAFVKDALRQFVISTYYAYYPNIEDWYLEKVIPGFLGGSRTIHVVRSSTAKPVYGVSITKRSDKDYDKICSFFLAPEARRLGIGTRLMECTLAALRSPTDRKPVLITVPEDRATEEADAERHPFLEFLKIFGFKVVDALPNRYRPGRTEIICVLNDK